MLADLLLYWSLFVFPIIVHRQRNHLGSVGKFKSRLIAGVAFAAFFLMAVAMVVSVATLMPIDFGRATRDAWAGPTLAAWALYNDLVRDHSGTDGPFARISRLDYRAVMIGGPVLALGGSFLVGFILRR